jgi:hypothetical protein
MTQAWSTTVLGASLVTLGLLLGSALRAQWQQDPRWLWVLLGVAGTVWLPAWLAPTFPVALSLPAPALPLFVLGMACAWLWVVVRMAWSRPAPDAPDALCLLICMLLSLGMLAGTYARRRR